MKALLQPGIALLKGMRFRGKFTLIGLILFSVIAVLMVSLTRTLLAEIEFVQKEQRGMAYLAKIVPVLIEVQKHRGLNNAYLSGDATAQTKLQTTEKSLEDLIAEVDKSAEGTEFRTAERWQAIKAAWLDIRANSSLYSKPQSFAVHTALIAELQVFISFVGDASNITLDSQLDSYYLQDVAFDKLVTLTEAVGKLRAKGAGVLAAHITTPDERAELTLLTGEVIRLERAARHNLEKSLRANSSLRARLEPASKNLSKLVEALQNTVQTQVLVEAPSMQAMSYFGLATSAIDGALSLYAESEKSLKTVLDARESELRRSMQFYMALVALMALVSVYFFVAMSASISATVGEIDEVVDHFAQGDLTRRIRVETRDEMGNIAERFNAAGDKLREVMQGVELSAAAVFDSAAQLKSYSRQIANDSEQQNESVASTAAAIEQITVSVSHVADSAREASNAAVSAVETSETGVKTVRRAAMEMNSIASSVSHSAELIEGLNIRAREISGIVNVIRDIADQTNLLALNAAIEAARAGEQGRGFAVVADEVRKLAERTGNATGEITAMIADIQRETANAVSSMQTGSAQAGRGVQLAEEAAAFLGQINAGAQDTRMRIEDIAAAMREQSAATNDIAGNLERISVMSEHSNEEVQQAIASIGRLEALAEKLRTDVMHFKV